MAKYEVRIPYCVWQTITIDDAEDEDDAEEQAWEEAGLTAFCGNGSIDRLVGVRDGSVEACEEPIDMGVFQTQVEKVEPS